MLANVTRSGLANRASLRRKLKSAAIGLGVVVFSTASLGQASAQSVTAEEILAEIFAELQLPVAGTIVVEDVPAPDATSDNIGDINVGGNMGGSVTMGGASGGVSIGGGASNSGGGGGSGNSAG